MKTKAKSKRRRQPQRPKRRALPDSPRPLGAILTFGPKDEDERRKLRRYQFRLQEYREYFFGSRLDHAKFMDLLSRTLTKLGNPSAFRHAVLSPNRSAHSRLFEAVAADIQRQIVSGPHSLPALGAPKQFLCGMKVGMQRRNYLQPAQGQSLKIGGHRNNH